MNTGMETNKGENKVDYMSMQQVNGRRFCEETAEPCDSSKLEAF